VGDNLWEPYFFPARLNRRVYLDFLRNVIQELLYDMPLGIRQNLLFMHNGVPPHFFFEVRIFLNNASANRWIGRGGLIVWPSWSPNLNVLDFYFWDHLKSIVYSTPVNNVNNEKGYECEKWKLFKKYLRVKVW